MLSPLGTSVHIWRNNWRYAARSPPPSTARRHPQPIPQYLPHQLFYYFAPLRRLFTTSPQQPAAGPVTCALSLTDTNHFFLKASRS
jgi:hypothetical protein